jgi:hypothetical protein
MGNNLLHLKDFVINQHSKCYLYFLEAKITNAPSDELLNNCIHKNAGV